MEREYMLNYVIELTIRIGSKKIRKLNLLLNKYKRNK